MKIKENEQAIDFAQEDIYGIHHSMEDFKRSKVYLSFLRVASCPFCNLRVHELLKKQAIWQNKGVTVILVFASPKNEILKYSGKDNPPLIILADPEENLYKKYGIGHSLAGKFKAMLRVKTLIKIMTGGFFNLSALFDKSILTGDFLIDENGIVKKAYYGKDFGDHISFEEIENWIQSQHQ